MDLKSLKVSDTAVLQLNHPITGKPLKDCKIEIHGRDSAKFRAMVHEEARSMQARSGKNADPVEIEENSFKRVCALTVGIQGLEEDGKPITDAAHLYRNYPWAYEQAQAFLLTRANFLPKA